MPEHPPAITKPTETGAGETVSAATPDSPPVSPRQRAVRVGVLCLLVLAIVAIALWLAYSPTGQLIRQDRKYVAQWVGRHPFISPAIFVGFYLLLVLLMIPVWWMQLLAGYCFGLVMGVFWSQLAGVTGSVGGMLISRFIAYDWFHRRIATRKAKLQAIDEKLGHNGLLVVMATRLVHVIPIGASNYVFGLTKISVMDVAIGSLIGGIPTVTAWAGTGAKYYDRPWFYPMLVALNIFLCIPLAIRYWKPQWFRKIGIE